MKTMNTLYKIVLVTFLTFTFSLTTLFAQNDTMYVMKNGVIINKQSVKTTDVDSIIFYKPTLDSSTTITDYDGNVYNTVTIGSQVWMNENLKTTHYANGTAIPLVIGNSNWDTLTATSKAYCWYGDDIANKATYGALYTWTAAMNGVASTTNNPSGIQGACPTGWHLPSNAEWTQLTTYLGGDSIAGGKLKAAGTIHWGSPNTSATNETGFTALPGGSRGIDGVFTNFRIYGAWWSASEGNISGAWAFTMYYLYKNVDRCNYAKEIGFSVRCLRD
jgi:uncharacterized protein (TIGR02145 family)